MSSHVLYVESYGSGSHLRMVDSLRSHSRHRIYPLIAGPDHWRWRYATAHYDLVPKLASNINAGNRPDLIVLSGPMNVGALIAALPQDYRGVPRVAYFHESQWTYPSPSNADTGHLLVSHLDALFLCDEAWFNSAFHRDTFRQAALEHPSLRMRRLARNVISDRWQTTRVVYPPVAFQIPDQQRAASTQKQRILWSARWEFDKRPDLFTSAIRALARRRNDFELVLLTPGSLPSPDADPRLSSLDPFIAIRGPLVARNDYEAAVRSCDVFVSTADHEFFGMAAIEAAMAGALPILPDALAYPETLPAAWFYRHHDVNHLVDVLDRVLDQRPDTLTTTTDALRFGADRTIGEFDDAVERITAAARC